MTYNKLNFSYRQFDFSFSTFADELVDNKILYFDEEYYFNLIDTDTFEIRSKIKLSRGYSIQYLNQDTFFFDGESKLFRLSSDNQQLELLYECDILKGYIAGLGSISLNAIIETYRRFENYRCIEVKTKIFDLENLATLFEIDNVPFIRSLEKNHVFVELENSTILAKIKCVDKEEQWRFKFAKQSFSSRIVYDGFGFFIAQGGQDDANAINSLVKIDKLTGESKWELIGTFHFYNYDKVRNKLYGLGGKTFDVIDVDTGNREMQKELDINLYVFAHLTSYADDFLYFSGHLDDNIPVFGAVNVLTGNLDFTQTIEMPGEKSFRKGLDRPVVVGSRLYVRDAMKTLHIFERQVN